MSNIHGLGSLSNQPDEPDGQQLHGGGAASGTATIRARDVAASARAAAASASAHPAAQQRNVGVVTLYANGFQLGDSPFRDSSEPANAAFLRELREGNVPLELEAECRRLFGAEQETVGLTLIDKSSETFVPPKPKFDFAKSQGQALGASAPVHVEGFGSAVPQAVVVDDGAPTVAVQFVLPDRKRVRAKFNLTHTVFDVYQHAMSLVSSDSFHMVAGFPPKPLSDPNATVADAGLKGASIQIRM